MLNGNEPISAGNLKAVFGAGRVLSRNVFSGSGTTNKYPSTAAARKVSFVGGGPDFTAKEFGVSCVTGGVYAVRASATITNTNGSPSIDRGGMVTLNLPNGAHIPVAHVVAGTTGAANMLPSFVEFEYEFEPGDGVYMNIAEGTECGTATALELRRIG